jgi:predicted transcriptional regulator
MKSDGVFLLSTPNDLESPEGNHYHIHEFKYEELLELVKKYFKQVESHFQGTWLYTAVVDKQELQNEWQKKLDTLNLSPLKPDTSMYFFYICSDVKSDLKVSSIAAVSEHLSMRRNIETETAMRNHMEEQSKVMNHLDGLLKNETAKNAQLEAEQSKVMNHLDGLLKNETAKNAQLEATITKLIHNPFMFPARVFFKIKRTIGK